MTMKKNEGVASSAFQREAVSGEGMFGHLCIDRNSRGFAAGLELR
jgi:hypothetical protein